MFSRASLINHSNANDIFYYVKSNVQMGQCTPTWKNTDTVSWNSMIFSPVLGLAINNILNPNDHSATNPVEKVEHTSMNFNKFELLSDVREMESSKSRPTAQRTESFL
jgi:hypothetical protein